MRMVIYGTSDCPWTEAVIDLIQEKGKKPDFKDVLQDFAAREEMFKKTKQYSTPVSEIDGNLIIGMDKEKIMKIIS
ncbi:NrdH-redoxin [Candidatus Woesearchaeota archaeon]|nr:NrdH-redoxin [Candidatus Woesearchaeota archaeon]